MSLFAIKLYIISLCDKNVFLYGAERCCTYCLQTRVDPPAAALLCFLRVFVLGSFTNYYDLHVNDGWRFVGTMPGSVATAGAGPAIELASLAA